MFKNLFSRGDGRAKKLAKFEKKITNMYIQPGDRQYFLHQLRAMDGEDAATSLLRRFTCSCENTTVDRDEKEMTCRLLVEMGQTAVPPLKAYLRNNDKAVNWPFRALKDLLSREALCTFLVEVLEAIGPEYVRDPERKEQLILTARDFDDPCIAKSVLPYLDDDNETIRFVAAETVSHHALEEGIAALVERFGVETSQRIINHIADAFASHGWVLDDVSVVEPHLPSGYSVTRQRTIRKG